MGKHKFSPESLLIEVNARTEASYKALHSQHFRGMFVVAVKITRDKMEAEDIVSTAFIKLYTTNRKIQFSSLSQVSGYIVSMVRNAAIDYRKMKHGVKEVSFPEDLYIPEFNDHGLDLFELKFRETVWTVVTDRVMATVESLDLECIKVLKLYYLEGKSTKQIAELLDLRPQTILNHKVKGREVMAKHTVRERWLLDTLLVIILLSNI